MTSIHFSKIDAMVGIVRIIHQVYRLAHANAAGVVGKYRVGMTSSSSTFLWNRFLSLISICRLIVRDKHSGSIQVYFALRIASSATVV